MNSMGEAKLSPLNPPTSERLRNTTRRSVEAATTRSGFPSPSKSPNATPVGPVPAAMSIRSAKVDSSSTPSDENVGEKGIGEYAVRPLTVREISPYVAPTGTVTLRKVGLASVTVARTGPKYTMFCDAAAAKLAPIIVTAEPGGLKTGVTALIVGAMISAELSPLCENRSSKANIATAET